MCLENLVGSKTKKVKDLANVFEGRVQKRSAAVKKTKKKSGAMSQVLIRVNSELRELKVRTFIGQVMRRSPLQLVSFYKVFKAYEASRRMSHVAVEGDVQREEEIPGVNEGSTSNNRNPPQCRGSSSPESTASSSSIGSPDSTPSRSPPQCRGSSSPESTSFSSSIGSPDSTPSRSPPQCRGSSSPESTSFLSSTGSPNSTTSNAEPELTLQPQQVFPDLPPETSLSNFIEVRVNRMLKCSAQHVFVREVHCQPKLFTPSTELLNFLEPFIPKEIIYNQRSLMCFQRTATGCVMFFYFSVQEYDKSCRPPYQNTAYIAMLDSVRHFQPSYKRTNVYNCILLSYLQYIGEIGFKRAFLWACPPKMDEEYVFYQRPKSQKTPTECMLIEWYNSMMDAGVQTGVLKSYSTLYDWCPKTTEEFFKTFPYYPGDHWLEQINETVKSLNKLAVNENHEVLLTAIKKKPVKSPCKRKTARFAINKYDYVFKEILHELKVYKRTFLCMTLNDYLLPKVSPETVIPNIFASSRDKILNFQTENDLTHSNLCDAIRTTKAFLFRLYISWSNTCGICRKTFTDGIQCKTCGQNICESCSGFALRHDHKSWMKIVPWREKESANASSKLCTLFTKYDFTRWNELKEMRNTGSTDFKSKFDKVYRHITETCKNKNQCSVCKAAMKYLFGPSTPPRTFSSSPSHSISTDDGSSDEGFSEETVSEITTNTNEISVLFTLPERGNPSPYFYGD